jgi:hypothetical protein
MKEKMTRIGITRGVHLIDAENLCGTPVVVPEQIVRLKTAYLASVKVGPLDHFILATSHLSVLALQAGWPGARYLMRSGKDGADIELAKVVLDENLDIRFDHVYFGSGDGGLAPFAAHLGARGLPVTAVTLIGSLSPRMKLATRDVIYLDRPGIAVLRSV